MFQSIRYIFIWRIFFSDNLGSISSTRHELIVYIIPDNTFKSHGWTLYLKRRETWHKRAKGDSPFFSNSFILLFPALRPARSQTENKSHLFISSKRSQEAVWLRSKTYWSPSKEKRIINASKGQKRPLTFIPFCNKVYKRRHGTFEVESMLKVHVCCKYKTTNNRALKEPISVEQ